MENILTIYNSTINVLNGLSIKYMPYNFSSGAIMLDIWYNNNFYVLQFEDDFVGFSEVVDSNVAFDNIPDEKFYEARIFKEKLETVFGIIINEW